MTQNQGTEGTQATEGTQDAANSASNSASEPTARHKPYVNVVRWTLVVLLPVILYPMFLLPAIQQRRRAACQSNLKQIALGCKQYNRDYDELFPPIYSDNDGSGRFDSARDQGWTQILQPYCKNLKIIQCPSEGSAANLTDGLQSGYTDYFMNRRLAGVNEAVVKYVANTVLFGDHHSCDAACNISGTSELDASAKAQHLQGANYAFADGHVKWLKPGGLTDAPVTAKNYSFQAK